MVHSLTSVSCISMAIFVWQISRAIWTPDTYVCTMYAFSAYWCWQIFSTNTHESVQFTYLVVCCKIYIIIRQDIFARIQPCNNRSCIKGLGYSNAAIPQVLYPDTCYYWLQETNCYTPVVPFSETGSCPSSWFYFKCVYILRYISLSSVQFLPCVA